MKYYLLVTATTVTLVYWRKSITRFLKQQIKNIPIVKYEIEKKTSEQIIQMEKQMFENFDPDTSIVFLNDKSLPVDALLEPLRRSYEDFLKRCKMGYFSGNVYIEPNDPFFKQLIDETVQIYRYTQYYNVMHATDFPLARQREAEVVSIIGQLYNYDKIVDDSIVADDSLDNGSSIDDVFDEDSAKITFSNYQQGKNVNQVFGLFTSGGTESNMCAMRAYFGIAKKKQTKKPVILAPISAHDSILTKSQDYGEIVRIELDPDTLKVSVEHMEKMLKKYKKRVIAIVGSTPTFAHGIIDPIDELSELAQKYGTYLHVDACLGSLLLPFIKSYAGFYYKGVTSVSVDPHKFGYCPKGSSVILYRSKDIMKHQFYVNPEWQGGLYTTPGIPGSKSAVNSMVSHYVINRIGRERYQDYADQIIVLKNKIVLELKKMEHIQVLGDPELSVVSIKSDSFNIYLLSDFCSENGVKMDKMQGPPFNSIHICLTLLHLNDHFLEKFIATVKNGINFCVELQKSSKDGKEDKDEKMGSEAALYGQVASLNKSDPELVVNLMHEYNFAVLRAVPLNLVPMEKRREEEFIDIRSRMFKFVYGFFK